MSRSASGALTVRQIRAEDMLALGRWLDGAFEQAPHAGGARAAIARAPENVENPESVVFVAERDGAPIGVSLFGVVAGSRAGRLAFLAVSPDARRQGVASALVEAIAADLAERGAAIILAEVADAPALAAAHALLARRGFTREGLVPDFYRDGVALGIWRLDCAGAHRRTGGGADQTGRNQRRRR